MLLITKFFRPSAIFAALAMAVAQTPADAPETVIRINVNVVQVDAVVTDASGKPVTNLKPQDFEILQDGKRQTITYFNYISTGAAPDGAAAAVAPAKKGKAQAGAALPPPGMLKPAQIHRTIALVVDDLGLSFSSMSYVRNAMKKWVDNDMQPGDLVAVIRTGAGMGALQQFTADKRLLYAAIDHVKFNALGRTGAASFGMGGGGMDEWRNQILQVGTIGAIRFVIDGLRELPGRKAVVLFSQNLRLFYSDGPNAMVMDEMQRLVDSANRASTVIYSIDPRGLQTYQPSAEVSGRGMKPNQLAQMPMRRAQEVFNSQDGMVLLADQTGGMFIHDTNDITGALRKVIADTDGYYLLGYHPDASTFDAKTGKAKFHHLSVRVKVAGLHVRSRSGFFGTSGGEYEPRTQGGQSEIAAALASPFGASAIHVRLTPLFSESATLGSYLSTLLFIDGKDLQFSDDPDGWHKAQIKVVVATYGENGVPVDPTDKTYTIRVRGAEYELARQGMVYSVSHPLKKPGPYQMRVVVRDETSGQVGSASQFIEVPDISKGHLTLSSLIVKEMPPAPPAQPTPSPAPSGTPAPSAAPAPAPASGQPAASSAAPLNIKGVGAPPTVHSEGQVAQGDANGSAAVRIFKPGTNILYGYQILNADAEAGKTPELEVQTHLFRDGQQIYEGKPMPLGLTSQTDPKHLLSGGSMRLGPKIAAGDYVLEVTVTDKNAKDKYRTATQWMDFVVQ